MVGAQRDDDGGVGQQRVEPADHRRHRQAAGQQRPARPARHALHRRLGARLAADRHVVAPADPGALQHEHDERRDQQHEREHGPALEVEQAGDLQIGLRREHRKVVAGEDQRRGEVGQRGGEDEQERVAEPGHRQRQRDRAEDAPARAAEAERHVLHVRIEGGQDGLERQVGERKVRQRLGGERAAEAVHREALQAEEVPGDEPARPEREDDRDRGGERRRDQRQQRRRVEDRAPAPRQAGAHGGEGEQEAERGAGDADQRAEQQAVAEGAQVIGVARDRQQRAGGEAAAVEEGAGHQRAQREDHEEGEQRPQHEHGDEEGRVPPQRGRDVTP